MNAAGPTRVPLTRPPMGRKVLSALTFLLCAPATMVAAAAPPGYTVSPITLDDGLDARGRDMNNDGDIVGDYATLDGNRHAFVYTDWMLYHLHGEPGRSSSATGINNAGQIAGYSSRRDGSGSQAYLFDRGPMRNLELPNGQFSYSATINDAGQMAGTAGAGTQRYSFVYQAGSIKGIDAPGDGDSWASDINERGEVVGGWTDAAGAQRGFIHSAGQTQDIGTLGGLRTQANAINDAGQIVGWSDNAAGERLAFVLNDGVMSRIGWEGAYWPTATAINSLGWVVGGSGLFADNYTYDLNNMIDPASGWVISEAVAINDRGQVLARGCYTYGCLSVRLDPIPEPSTWAMLLAGVAALGMWQQWRSPRSNRHAN